MCPDATGGAAISPWHATSQHVPNSIHTCHKTLLAGTEHHAMQMYLTFVLKVSAAGASGSAWEGQYAGEHLQTFGVLGCLLQALLDPLEKANVLVKRSKEELRRLIPNFTVLERETKVLGGCLVVCTHMLCSACLPHETAVLLQSGWSHKLHGCGWLVTTCRHAIG